MAVTVTGRDTSELDAINVYMSDVGRYALLTAEDEVRLAQTIEAGREAEEKLLDGEGLSPAERRVLMRQVRAGERAKDDFCNSNLRLVINQARRYLNTPGIDFVDLIQEGNLGLIRAVEKFDWRKGFKFSTYATWWIRQALSKAIAEKSRTVRIPLHLHEKLSTVRSTASRLNAELGRIPTPEEISSESGIDLKDVIDSLAVTDAVSLDRPIGEDGAVLGDFVEDAEGSDPVVEAVQSVVGDELRTAILRLPERLQRILLLRYGFADGVARTHDEIGQEFGLTRERIRQLEKIALCRMRHPTFGMTSFDE